VIDFDAEGTLRQYDVMQEAELCTRRRICFDDDLLTIAATEAEDQAAKTFTPPSAGCSLFLFSDSTSAIIPSRAAFRFLPLGDITTRDSFYHLAIAAGSHHLAVGPAGALWHGTGAITEVDCADGQLIFVRYRKGGMWGSPRLETVEESEGRAAIGQRWLARADSSD